MVIQPGLRNRAMVSAVKDEDIDKHSNGTSKCPKCLLDDMVEHPSLLSIPLTSYSKTGGKAKPAIEDQDADFAFKFISCRNCGYSELYLLTHDIRKRI